MTEARQLTEERLLAERVLATGTLKWFSDADGYGCISPDEGEGDLLVHCLDCSGLPTGARVVFEVNTGPRGLEAYNVVPLQ
jgi:CspA family cold shock protein